MPTEKTVSLLGRLEEASQEACRRSGNQPPSRVRLEDALSNALDPQKLIDNYAEAWRVSPDDARLVLEGHGFGGVLARLRATVATVGQDEVQGEPLSAVRVMKIADGRISARAMSPALDERPTAPRAVLEAVSKGIGAFLPGADDDALGVLYRREPAAYAAKFLAEDAPKIDAYIGEHFGAAGPRYLVNSGIGANEQFNYFVSALANARPDRRVTWLLANSPKELACLPADATVENTLFMEFSRSGITEETVKLHELSPRGARRVVFANTGSLQALGRRDGNLVLELPSEVSGRYGRNKTPILMAPMHVAGLGVGSYWETIETACATMGLGDQASAPVVLAQYIRLQQLRRGINHIYLGTNDSLLRYSADELCQYWNEGVNRDGNDMTMSRYLGLPRDSHMNLEAMLGTSEHKMAIFLLRTSGVGSHGLLTERADPINAAHAGLSAGDVDLVLAAANVKRCSEKMPTVVICVDRPDLRASAWLGQLWADTTLVYARLIGVDPGSNPEVKAVRTRAAEWLADKNMATELVAGG
ncbi:MAG: hypothetical protein ABII12_18235 [Planctomycetota bacterium]